MTPIRCYVRTHETNNGGTTFEAFCSDGYVGPAEPEVWMAQADADTHTRRVHVEVTR